ncbi:hypothetical protein [Nocardioides sp.]|uniref:hypothetical protein n=1 Tax=Nocardioides sp. TaxID=35761 RepID=UPI002C781A2C|nr:hypothetical protein [Nocardioides sp.]HSX65934.1 hypothetical protein [Nocardioides sp.]
MTTSKASRVLRQATSATSALLLAALLAACSLAPSTGPLAWGTAWQKTCPTGTLATYVTYDISASSSPQPFGGGQDQYAVLEDAVARTAVCGGHLLVTGFAGSSANPYLFWDGDLSLPGATDNARYRRLPDLIKQIDHEVANNYNATLNRGPFPGTDVIGQLRLAAEYAEQVGPDASLWTIVVTDGLQTVSTQKWVISNAEDARAFADSVSVPKLSGELLFTGLGDRIDGEQVSTVTVENLKSIYARVCERTSASACQAVTDYTSPVGSGS